MDESNMTERERRRAKSLPQSPATLALVESIQKDTEEKMRHMIEMMRPVLAHVIGPTSKMMESLSIISKPLNEATSVIARMAEAQKSSLSDFGRIYEPKEYVIPAIRYTSGPRTVRLALDQFDALVKKVTTQETPQNTLFMDLMYDRKTKELYRYVYNQRFASTFKDSEDNKRLLLLEKLIDAGKPVATKKLAEFLQCTQKAVQNLVQAINAKIDDDLHLPQPFIKANRGSGYYINKFYCVYTAK